MVSPYMCPILIPTFTNQSTTKVKTNGEEFISWIWIDVRSVMTTISNAMLSSHVLFADASSHIPPQLGRLDSAKSQLGKTSPEVDICKTKWWIYDILFGKLT